MENLGRGEVRRKKAIVMMSNAWGEEPPGLLMMVLTGVGLLIVLGGTFYGIDQFNALRWERGFPFWSPELSFDRAIPFWPGWIWLYVSYFPLCFAGIKLLTTNGRVVALASGFAVQHLIGGAIFVFRPSRMVFPPVDGDTVSERAILLLRDLDPGFNIFPSMHVANVIMVAICFSFVRSSWGIWIWIWTLLVSVSTVLVKQHYLVDVPSGILLGIIGALWARQLGMRPSR